MKQKNSELLHVCWTLPNIDIMPPSGSYIWNYKQKCLTLKGKFYKQQKMIKPRVLH